MNIILENNKNTMDVILIQEPPKSLIRHVLSYSDPLEDLIYGKRVQKGIAHWDKQNNDVPAPNCVLKVQGEIIKIEGL